MSYSEMSDFEINRAVTEIWRRVKVQPHDVRLPEVPYAFYDGEEIYIKDPDPLSGSWRQFNPCNSWSDAGPIIEKNRITLDSAPDVWFVRDDDHCHTHKNPLRAAMIVFLMMQEKVNA